MGNLQSIQPKSFGNEYTITGNSGQQSLAGPSAEQLAKQNKDYGKIIGGMTNNAN